MPNLKLRGWQDHYIFFADVQPENARGLIISTFLTINPDASMLTWYCQRKNTWEIVPSPEIDWNIKQTCSLD